MATKTSKILDFQELYSLPNSSEEILEYVSSFITLRLVDIWIKLVQWWLSNEENQLFILIDIFVWI